MNEKITLPALIQLLSIATGDTKKQSEDFLREFFSAISDSLSVGEQVKIKGLGVFKTIIVEERKSVNVSTGSEHTIPAHRKVVFVPSKDLAALVNEPFEMFETVEIEDDSIFDDPVDVQSEKSDVIETPSDEEAEQDDVEQEDVEQEDIEQEDIEQEDVEREDVEREDVEQEDVEREDVEQEVIAQDTDIAIEEEVESDDQDSTVKEPVYENLANDKAVESPVDEAIIVSENVTDPEQPQYEMEQRRHTKFWSGFLIGFLVALLLMAVAIAVSHNLDLVKFEREAASEPVSVVVIDSSEEAIIVEPESIIQAEDSSSETIEDHNAEEIEPEKESPVRATVSVKEDLKDSESVPTQVSDKKIYDTISQTRYLTTMAKQYYGNYHLWPYIYIENQAFLGHPDRIKPGTKVVIPPLSKYGVNPKNPADIEKAKKKGIEIYSRYK